MGLVNYLRTLPSRQHVRPWALAAPILVLLAALPLLRPLRASALYEMSNNELSRLAAIEAMGDYQTLAIEHTAFFPTLQSRRQSGESAPPDTLRIGNSYYSDRAPVMAFLLAGPYWVMHRFGLSFAPGQENAWFAIYLLTLLGVTLPVAGAAGLVYRMGRLLELRRTLRTLLAIIVVFGSGLISYATVLNPHAPAAALLLAACACIAHIILSKTRRHSGTWLMVSGFCAALATTIDLAAGIFLIGLIAVIITMNWTKARRLGGVVLYLFGTLPPLVLHATLTIPVTGDVLPGFLHHGPYIAAVAPESPDDDSPADTGWIHRTLEAVEKILGALIGSRGMLSHFPVVAIGLLGIGVVLRRHWPATIKALACLTLAGTLIVILSYVFFHADWTQEMFGPRWFILFLPLLLFWAGAWMRRPHKPAIWIGAAILLLFSITVSLIGMTDPFVHAETGQHTAAAAVERMLQNPQTRTTFAGG